jgi:hypothetical protein
LTSAKSEPSSTSVRKPLPLESNPPASIRGESGTARACRPRCVLGSWNAERRLQRHQADRLMNYWFYGLMRIASCRDTTAGRLAPDLQFQPSLVRFRAAAMRDAVGSRRRARALLWTSLFWCQIHEAISDSDIELSKHGHAQQAFRSADAARGPDVTQYNPADIDLLQQERCQRHRAVCGE